MICSEMSYTETNKEERNDVGITANVVISDGLRLGRSNPPAFFSFARAKGKTVRTLTSEEPPFVRRYL
jgi:hypothetical protein